MRRLLVFTLALALLLPALPLLPTGTVAADSGSNWTGEYFDNRDVLGSPRYVRLDSAISFDWGTASPVPGVIPQDNFSVRWSGPQYFDGGTYTFSAAADDGIRVWVDGTLIIDAWYGQILTTHTGQATLSAGQHWVRVEYFEGIDLARVYVSWRPAAASSAPGWIAEYYNNTNVQDPQVAGQLEPSIDHNWGGLSPFPGIVNADNFSVRWYGFPDLAGGTYEFVAGADDGVRVWVDETLVIDAWNPTVYQESRGTLTLNGGVHTIRVEYYDLGDQARVSFYWIYKGPAASDSGGGAAVSSDQTATVTAYRLNVRSGPGVGNAIVTKINQGETYAVIGRNEDGSWYQISGTGFTGWVSGGYVTISGDTGGVPVAEPGSGVPAGTLLAQSSASLRVRRGPGTNQARVAALGRGESAQVIGRTIDSTWLQIRKDDGTEGWVAYTSYISLIGGVPLTSIPVTG